MCNINNPKCPNCGYIQQRPSGNFIYGFNYYVCEKCKEAFTVADVKTNRIESYFFTTKKIENKHKDDPKINVKLSLSMRLSC